MNTICIWLVNIKLASLSSTGLCNCHIRYIVGSDLSDIYLSGNLIYPTEDWRPKSAAYYCIDTCYSTSVLPDMFKGTD